MNFYSPHVCRNKEKKLSIFEYSKFFTFISPEEFHFEFKIYSTRFKTLYFMVVVVTLSFFKRHTTNAYTEVEVQSHAFLSSALRRS